LTICEKYCTPQRCIKHAKIAGYMHLLVGYNALIKEVVRYYKEHHNATIIENIEHDKKDNKYKID